MRSLLRTFSRALTSVGLAALGWSVVAQAQGPTVFNACVTPLTGLLYQPKVAGKCFLPSHQAIKWTDALGAFLGATTLGGDLSGTLPSPTVKGLRGHPVSATNPTAGQILIWDGTMWAPGNQVGGSSGAAGGVLTGTYPNPGLADGAVSEAKLAFNPATQEELDAASATAAAAAATLQTNINAASEALNAYKALLANSGGTANAAGNPVSWTQLKDVPSGVISGGGASGVAGGDLSGNYPNPAVAKLQGTAVSSTAPTSGQVLAFNGTSWTPAAVAASGGGLPCAGCVNGASIADGAVTRAKLAADAPTAFAFAQVEASCGLRVYTATVISCSRGPNNSRPDEGDFEITLSEPYSVSSFITVVTPQGFDQFVSSTSAGGKLIVTIRDATGGIGGAFQFVTYKVP